MEHFKEKLVSQTNIGLESAKALQYAVLVTIDATILKLELQRKQLDLLKVFTF